MKKRINPVALEVKSMILKSGYTQSEIVDMMSADYGWSSSPSNFSRKLNEGTLRYDEAMELAKALGYTRPKMMRLLELINTGMYAGVVCMDIERLSRGSSVESGHIMQALQLNSCKIITSGKTYDLQNDSDEQFTDMKFMFSRYELKTINKRLVRGRNQSASEGKFMGSIAPYGYHAFKLPGEKGNSLRIEPEEVKVVQMIFEMYGKQSMGYTAIAYTLNDMHIPTRKGGEWNFGSIVNILNNGVYLGKIRWRKEPVKRVIKDGIPSHGIMT